MSDIKYPEEIKQMHINAQLKHSLLRIAERADRRKEEIKIAKNIKQNQVNKFGKEIIKENQN